MQQSEPPQPATPQPTPPQPTPPKTTSTRPRPIKCKKRNGACNHHAGWEDHLDVKAWNTWKAFNNTQYASSDIADI